MITEFMHVIKRWERSGARTRRDDAYLAALYVADQGQSPVVEVAAAVVVRIVRSLFFFICDIVDTVLRVSRHIVSRRSSSHPSGTGRQQIAAVVRCTSQQLPRRP